MRRIALALPLAALLAGCGGTAPPSDAPRAGDAAANDDGGKVGAPDLGAPPDLAGPPADMAEPPTTKKVLDFVWQGEAD